MAQKLAFTLAKGVSNVELFYDLIFVYCISVITGVLHHPTGGFFSLESYALYAVDMLTILQVWFFTTFLQNRYGDGGAFDNVCLFINMFLLFFMAGCVGENWQGNMFTWNLVWAFILIDLLVHWAIKRVRYVDIDDIDRRIMNRTMIVLGIQATIVLFAAFLPWEVGQWISLAAFAFGWLAFAQSGRLAEKPSRFDHLVERCSLLVIVMFGETIVGIAGYMSGETDIAFAVLVFLLVVGLFLVYFTDYDNMLDHERRDPGIGYMVFTAALVFVLGNITVALEYLPEQEVLLVPKAMFLAGGISVYLLMTLVMFKYNRDGFKMSPMIVVSRVLASVALLIASVLVRFDPLLMLMIDVALVWLSLLAEYLLLRVRSRTAG